MNYLIIYDDVGGRFDKADIHKVITEQLSATNWWHYLSKGYIITTSVPSAGITNTLSNRYPGLLFLIIKIDLDDASGVLPKEAFDWIRNKSSKFVKIKQTPLPKIKIAPPLVSSPSEVLFRSLGLPSSSTKTRPAPWTINDFFKNTLPEIK